MSILAVWVLLLSAAPAAQPVPPVTALTVSPASVVVKLGSASLEEYRHADPDSRIQLTRSR